jgi:hypothetical protein
LNQFILEAFPVAFVELESVVMQSVDIYARTVLVRHIPATNWYVLAFFLWVGVKEHNPCAPLLEVVLQDL